MWSLVTETKKGVDNRTEATPLTIDHQYNVGFSWARQYGFRVARNFGNKMWLAVSVENPQATVTTHNNATNFLVGSLGAGRITGWEYGWRGPLALVLFCLLAQQLSLLPFRLMRWPSQDCLAVGVAQAGRVEDVPDGGELVFDLVVQDAADGDFDRRHFHPRDDAGRIGAPPIEPLAADALVEHR